MKIHVSVMQKMLVGLCVIGLLVPTVGGASDFFVQITGKSQGKFRTPTSQGIKGLGYRHEIISPRDASSGQASGRRQHGAITIVKEWDVASPQLFHALVTNETLTKVEFLFQKASKRASSQTYYKVTLSDASVSKIEYRAGTEQSSEAQSLFPQNSAPELEYVSFTYRKISVENVDGKTASEDDWSR